MTTEVLSLERNKPEHQSTQSGSWQLLAARNMAAKLCTRSLLVSHPVILSVAPRRYTVGKARATVKENIGHNRHSTLAKRRTQHAQQNPDNLVQNSKSGLAQLLGAAFAAKGAASVKPTDS